VELLAQILDQPDLYVVLLVPKHLTSQDLDDLLKLDGLDNSEIVNASSKMKALYIKRLLKERVSLVLPESDLDLGMVHLQQALSWQHSDIFYRSIEPSTAEPSGVSSEDSSLRALQMVLDSLFRAQSASFASVSAFNLTSHLSAMNEQRKLCSVASVKRECLFMLDDAALRALLAQRQADGWIPLARISCF
jgi:hypothetical protein